jgi:putative hemolysin
MAIAMPGTLATAAALDENRATMRSISLLISCLLLATGCAVLSDVTPIGPDAFMTTAHSNDVNARVEEQKAKVAQSATDFCAHRGGQVEVIRLQADAPPPGRPPTAELDFRCKAG